MNSRKLLAWRDAGLIDDAAVERIMAFEAQSEKPLGLWAALGVGALAIGLGIISVVAANWDDVPGAVRLAIHFALMAALAAFLALRANRLERDHGWWLEAGLFVLALLGLSFFGHVGQVYQTTSPLWKPLLAWLVLFAPLLMLRGQSWLTAALLFIITAVAAWDCAGETLLPGNWGSAQSGYPLTATIITALPVLFAIPAAASLRAGARETFWRRLKTLAIAYAVLGASLMVLASGGGHFTDVFVSLPAQALRAGIAVIAAGGIAVLYPGTPTRAASALTVAAGLACMAAWVVSGSQTGAGLLFMALWSAIAFICLRAGWRAGFQLAIAAIALRLIVLSFELAGDLLTSGFGLILSGLMILGVAWGAMRVSRQFAPSKEHAQ